MTSGDETYLEAFMESLSTLPHELKRNLELIKDLDKSSLSKMEELLKLHQEYRQVAFGRLSHIRIIRDAANSKKQNNILGMQLLSSVLPHQQQPQQQPPKNSTAEEDEDEEEDDDDDTDMLLFLPTTDELVDYVHDAELHKKIQKLEQECLQKADEKVAIAQQAFELIDAKVQRLDRDIASMEKLLQASGDLDSGVTVKPNALAACQISPGAEWILAKVIQHDPIAGMYQLADEDVESNKIFHLPEAQVQVLHPVEKLRSGDRVYAVYPDTTSFYLATVVQAPRRQQQQQQQGAASGSTSASSSSAFVMLQFQDDADEFGITHDKAVPLKHVMLPPP